MNGISQAVFSVPHPEETSAFYRELLGMENTGQGVGYDGEQASLVFIPAASRGFVAVPSDFYWKIGITVRNLDHAVGYLQKQSWPVTDPKQFRDIGYLCHLHDPNGFPIELLQQNFKGNSPAGKPPGHAIGGQATLAHLTLRVNDINRAQDYLQQQCRMRLISVQPVTDLNFCLYFFAWDRAPLPTPELDAVENREWLWARPYTLIELQHVMSADAAVAPPDETGPGFCGLAMTVEGEDKPAYHSVIDLFAALNGETDR